MYKALLSLFIMCVFSYAKDFNYNRTVPEKLLKYAKEHGCDINLKAFNAIEGNVYPPYVDGILKGPTYDSTAIVCEKDDDTFILIYVDPMSKIQNDCPILHRTGSSKSFGLKLSDKKWEFEYSNFPYKQTSRKENEFSSKMLLMTNDYYVTVGFVCYKGSWLERLLAD